MVNPVCLVEGTLLTAGAVTLYTSPGNTVTIVKKITLVNTDNLAAHRVTLNLIASGGNAGLNNLLLDQRSVPALSTLDVTEAINQILAAGDFISALADVGGLVNIRVSGVQVS